MLGAVLDVDEEIGDVFAKEGEELGQGCTLAGVYVRVPLWLFARDARSGPHPIEQAL